MDIVDIVDGAVICFLKFFWKYLNFPESCFKDCLFTARSAWGWVFVLFLDVSL